MSSNHKTLSVCLFVLIVVGGGSVLLRSEGTAPTELPEVESSAELAARVSELEQELQGLRTELQVLRRDPARDSVQARTTSAGTASGRGRAGGLDLLPGNQSAEIEVIEGDDPALRARLADAVRDELALEREERWERRKARRAERRERRLQSLAAEANLSDEQLAALSELLADEADQIGTLFHEARQDGSFDEVRETARTIREESDSAVEGLLDSSQIESYSAMREEQRARFRH